MSRDPRTDESAPLTGPHADPTGDPPPDPRFVCDWTAVDDPDDTTQRWSTWHQVEPLCRGPQPYPDWLVTSRAAIDTECGVLKTGKEADVHLVERAVPGDPDLAVVLAAKRYRSTDHRSFHRSAVYTEGRRTRRSRDARAVAAKSAYGREVAAAQWATAEWDALVRLWSAGLAVPYPVQVDGTELLMEFVGEGTTAAPRLAATRPAPDLLASWWDQARAFVLDLAALGFVHGDLSPYNILADGERLVVIDLPQLVDLAANPSAWDLLHRDCRTVARWFVTRGLDPRVADGEALFGEAIAHAW